VAPFPCHPGASVVCAAKDPGEPRDVSRFSDTLNRAFGSLPYQTAPLPQKLSDLSSTRRQLERPFGWGLLCAHAPDRDISDEVVLSSDRIAGQPAQHGQLAHVSEGVGDWALKKHLHRSL